MQAPAGYAGTVITRWLRFLVRLVVSAKGSFVRRLRSASLRRRWNSLHNQPAHHNPNSTDSDEVFKRLDIVVINLKSRPDRLEEVSAEMARIGISRWRRLDAVDGRQQFPNLDPFYSGSIGCSLSHVLAFSEARWDECEALLVCEDDVEFLVDRETIAGAIREFLDNPNLDVLALYGKARGGSHQISDNLRIAVGLVGTVCYVIKPHMAEVIGELFTAGVADLQASKRRGKSDVLWNRLQARDYFFATPIGSYSRNREGFSDIEGRLLGPR